MGEFEADNPSLCGSGEGSLLMSEQLQQDQIGGKIAAQFTLTNARESRLDRRWIARAINSVPCRSLPGSARWNLLAPRFELASILPGEYRFLDDTRKAAVYIFAAPCVMPSGCDSGEQCR